MLTPMPTSSHPSLTMYEVGRAVNGTEWDVRGPGDQVTPFYV